MAEYLARIDSNGEFIDAFVEGMHYDTDKERQKIIDEENAIPITEEQFTKLCDMKGGANGTGYIYNFETNEVVSAPARVISAEEARDAKIAEFEEKRYAEELAPIEYDSGSGKHTFDYGLHGFRRLQILQKNLENTNGDFVEWTDENGESVSLSADDFKSINSAAADRMAQLNAKFVRLKLKIETASTADEVNAITWEESSDPDDELTSIACPSCEADNLVKVPSENNKCVNCGRGFSVDDIGNTRVVVLFQ